MQKMVGGQEMYSTSKSQKAKNNFGWDRALVQRQSMTYKNVNYLGELEIILAAVQNEMWERC